MSPEADPDPKRRYLAAVWAGIFYLITGLLADLPANLLPGILATLSLDIPLLGPVLQQLTGGDLDLLLRNE